MMGAAVDVPAPPDMQPPSSLPPPHAASPKAKTKAAANTTTPGNLVLKMYLHMRPSFKLFPHGRYAGSFARFPNERQRRNSPLETV
jgi:hypothetical protein